MSDKKRKYDSVIIYLPKRPKEEAKKETMEPIESLSDVKEVNSSEDKNSNTEKGDQCDFE